MAEARTTRPGRNEPCHCGSGKKYKHCCLASDEEADRAMRAQQAAEAQPPAPPEDEHAHRAAPPARAPAQSWKRTGQTNRGPRRVTTPRKAG